MSVEPQPTQPNPNQPEPAQSPAPTMAPAQPNQPMAQPYPEPPVDIETQAVNELSYSWEASEYIFHQKPLWWYAVLWLVVALVCAGLAFFQQWLSIAVVIAMALAIVTYSRKPPRTLQYRLDSDGVTIDGKTTPFDQYKSFSVWEEVGWHEVDLEPTKRFVPRLTLICESEDMDNIVEIIDLHLPRQDRKPDLIERASRYVRF